MWKLAVRFFCAMFFAAVATSQAATPDTGLYFIVLVKSSNYSQNRDGELTRLNYHFFSEVFPHNPDTPVTGSLRRDGVSSLAMFYEKRESNHYIEGGHFDTVEEADQTHPNGLYRLSVKTDKVHIVNQQLNLASDSGATEIPEPITIHLSQGGNAVAPDKLDPDQTLTISWSEYSNGRDDPRGIVDDMIFVVMQDCTGARIVHTGLPFNGPYMTWKSQEVTVDASKLKPGHPYSIFVEFPHVVDSRMAEGVPIFSSYATATYLDLVTQGEAQSNECLDSMPPMDTGQTDR
ncbi:MAG: hypothetical protein CMQ12_00730 [Gammaproteobacteria bacterium]|nr:hypothetical protein [Gammaproteobacteria bacterium]